MLETLTLSADSESWMAAAYSFQNRNLPRQLTAYAAMIESRIHYSWVNNHIVHPVSHAECVAWRRINDAMIDAAVALTHVERGIGNWCDGCRYDYSGHQTGIDRGARALGLR